MSQPVKKLSRESIRRILIDFGRSAALRAGASQEEVEAIWQEIFGVDR